MNTIIVMLNDENDQQIINKIIEKYANNYQLIISQKFQAPTQLNILFKKFKSEKEFLKEALANINNDFIIYNLHDDKLENPIEFEKLLKFDSQVATNSATTTNSRYPEISFETDSKDLKYAQFKEEQLKALNFMNSIINIKYLNPDIFAVNFKIYQELKGFDWELDNYLTIVYDYAYRVNNNLYKNNLKCNYVFFQKYNLNHLQTDYVSQNFKNALDKYNKKYLGYEQINYEHCKKIRKFQTDLRLTFSEGDINGNILYIATSDIFTNGLNNHLKDLYQNIKNYNIYVLIPTFSINELKYFELKYYLNGQLIDRIKIPFASSMHISNFENPEYEYMLKTIFKIYKINIMHVHIAALGHNLSCTKIAKKLGITTYVSLHDLYYISGDFTQHNLDIEYDAQFLNEKYSIQAHQKFNQKFKKNVQDFLNHTDQIIAFSYAYPDIYAKFYTLPPIKIIEHGYNYQKRYKLGSKTKNKKLKIVYFGRVEEEKGSELIKEIAKKLKDQVEFHVLGTTNDKWFKKRGQKVKDGVKYYGQYNSEKLLKVLTEIKPNIAIIPSIWAEAFAYTLTESYLYGIIPLVTPQGALKDRVQRYQAGFIAKETTANSLIEEILNINALDELSLEKEIEKVHNVHITTVHEMANNYVNLYETNNLTKTSKTKLSAINQEQKIKLQQLIIENSPNLFTDYMDYYHNKTLKQSLVDRSRLWKIAQKIHAFRNRKLKE